jgi:hypothetical protein
MPQQNASLIRLGILALPLAGLLALVGLYSTLQLGPGGILASRRQSGYSLHWLLRERVLRQCVSPNGTYLRRYGSVHLLGKQ